MCKEFNRIYTLQETLEYYHLTSIDSNFTHMTAPIEPKTYTRHGNKFDVTYEIGLNRLGESIPVDSINDIEGFRIDINSCYEIPCNLINPNAIFNPIKTSEFKYPISIVYNPIEHQFYHNRLNNDCYLLIYRLCREQPIDDPMMKPLIDYISQFPKNTIFIQKLHYVSHHTLIINNKKG